MRNFFVGLAVLFGLAVAVKADDGMHGGWCPTDGWVYQLNWVASWTCYVDANGGSTCYQEYECIQLYPMCKANQRPRLGGEPMDIDKRRNA